MSIGWWEFSGKSSITGVIRIVYVTVMREKVRLYLKMRIDFWATGYVRVLLELSHPSHVFRCNYSKNRPLKIICHFSIRLSDFLSKNYPQKINLPFCIVVFLFSIEKLLRKKLLCHFLKQFFHFLPKNWWGLKYLAFFRCDFFHLIKKLPKKNPFCHFFMRFYHFLSKNWSRKKYFDESRYLFDNFSMRFLSSGEGIAWKTRFARFPFP